MSRHRTSSFATSTSSAETQAITLFDVIASENGLNIKILCHNTRVRDVTAQETRFELSRPVKMDSDGHVDVWVERIIFAASPFGTDTLPLPVDVPKSPEIVPEVKRKSA